MYLQYAQTKYIWIFILQHRELLLVASPCRTSGCRSEDSRSRSVIGCRGPKLHSGEGVCAPERNGCKCSNIVTFIIDVNTGHFWTWEAHTRHECFDKDTLMKCEVWGLPWEQWVLERLLGRQSLKQDQWNLWRTLDEPFLNNPSEGCIWRDRALEQSQARSEWDPEHKSSHVKTDTKKRTCGHHEGQQSFTTYNSYTDAPLKNTQGVRNLHIYKKPNIL